MNLRTLPGLAVAVVLTVADAIAAPLNLEITSERRRFTVEKQQTESTNSSSEKWGYKVVLTNKEFKAVASLDIVYRVYKVDESRHTTAGKLIATPGSVAIASLKPSEKFTFNTEPVLLNSSSIKGGWVYTDKGKSKVEDSVAGLWIRVMQGGIVVFEHIKPPTLKNKATWE
ncbi:MAG TPA: hypothetical protein VFG14_19800 [Chthoniobacteraceae bacterium]|nr:hypothetical protein [Chthoniobacteraceae bacterium]